MTKLMRLEFSPDDIIRGHHKADLGKFGDFVGDCVIVDPDDIRRFTAVGTLHTCPQHLDEPVEIRVELDIELDDDYVNDAVDAELNATLLFQGPWRWWGTCDIPQEWEY